MTNLDRRGLQISFNRRGLHQVMWVSCLYSSSYLDYCSNRDVSRHELQSWLSEDSVFFGFSTTGSCQTNQKTKITNLLRTDCVNILLVLIVIYRTQASSLRMSYLYNIPFIPSLPQLDILLYLLSSTFSYYLRFIEILSMSKNFRCIT